MANTAQARKRARQNDTHRVRNAGQRSGMRTAIKSFLKLVEAKDSSGAQAAYRQASSLIDRAARKHLHHPNKAARLKQRLNARLRALAS